MGTGRVPTIRQAIGSVSKTSQPRGIPAATLQQTGDRQVNDLQRAIAGVTLPLRAHPHGNGLYVQKAQAFTAGGTVTIQHGLGRAFQGFEVKNVQGNYSRFILVPNNDANLDKRQIKIQSEAACTADVWVY